MLLSCSGLNQPLQEFYLTEAGLKSYLYNLRFC
jgi:hypothetical protein